MALAQTGSKKEVDTKAYTGRETEGGIWKMEGNN